MASSDKPDPESVKTETAPPPPPPSKCRSSYFSVDIGLRVLLFAATLSAVIVMVTSKQTKLIPVTGIPIPVPVPAKFNHSPALIYFVAALSVACLYSIISTLASISIILKPSYATKFLLYLAFWDVLMLGIVAAATGASGGVAYIGLKGNSHVRWNKICNTYDVFCRHIGSAIALSLFAAVLLVFLIMSSVCSLHRRARDCN